MFTSCLHKESNTLMWGLLTLTQELDHNLLSAALQQSNAYISYPFYTGFATRFNSYDQLANKPDAGNTLTWPVSSMD